MRIDGTDFFNISRSVHSSVLQALKYYSEDIALGGECIRKIITGESVDTYDIYISDSADIMPSDIIDYLEEYEQFLPYKVKFIMREFKTPWELMEQMDFTVESAAMTYENGTWNPHCHERFYIDNTSKRLRCLNDVGGVSSLLKVMEYKNKGYSINNAELAKILAEIVAESDIFYEESQTAIMLDYIEMLDAIKPDYE